MKQNLPVTGREFVVPDECEMLISVSDLAGRMTYCNDAFIKTSGYSSSELIGQPHNLVRHPDMPKDVFRDLWDTIQRGFPWVGVVKNRRKNGDHYWVVVHATPVRDGDRVTGYLSVRMPATRAQIDAAERACKRMARHNEMAVGQ